MKIEDTVCSLKQSKKLAELGVKLDTLYVWFRHTNKFVSSVKSHKWFLMRSFERTQMLHAERFPALTVAELGVLLFPDQVFFNPECGLWGLIDSDGCETHILENSYSFNETQARADALIWLIENEYVNAKELKL